ncbi:MAG: radical SAM protein [Candidatus Omnitrophota bacterium]|nr:radical SAM protein [Candidatus Omnitrophota bacterium]
MVTAKNDHLIFPGARLFTKKDAVFINKERKTLLSLLEDKACHSFIKNKIHIGSLSTGCHACGQGTWSCAFIHNKCNIDCFFCPGKRSSIGMDSVKTEGIFFNNPEDYADYIKIFGFKGVGISGGEPFLVFDKLVRYIKKIREKTSDDLYIWVYTNGSLVDVNKLRILKDCGLNEIRFNISGRGYGLGPVKMAIGIIDNVTIEIPAIPEDYEIVKKLLHKLYTIGVNFLNLHQMDTFPRNYKGYIKRKYTLLDIAYSPVFASEVTALKLLKYALDKKIKLPINYCSSAYKNNIQLSSRRKRFALWLRNKTQYVTDSGYIRSFSAQGSKKDLNLSYYKPVVGGRVSKDTISRQLTLNSGRIITLRGEPVFHFEKISPLARKTFIRMFIDKENFNKALEYFYRNYTMLSRKDVRRMEKESAALLTSRQWELIGNGFPSIKPWPLPFSFYD